MSGVLRAGGGPARLLVAMFASHDGKQTIPPSKAVRRLTDLGYATHSRDTWWLVLTPAGYAAARALRDGS